MNAQTKLSAKGQVVIPKDVRDRLGLTEGTVFDVIERGGEIILRLPAQQKRLTIEEAAERIRKIVQYKGPRLSDEDIAAAGPVMAAEKYRNFVKNSSR